MRFFCDFDARSYVAEMRANIYNNDDQLLMIPRWSSAVIARGRHASHDAGGGRVAVKLQVRFNGPDDQGRPKDVTVEYVLRDVENFHDVFAISKNPSLKWEAQVEKRDARLFVNDNTLYLITSSGALLRYHHDTNGAFDISAQPIGTGWGGLRFVGGARGGHLYGLNSDQELLYYRHDGANWPVTQKAIGDGWGAMRWVGVARFGELYAINGEGTLLAYKHDALFRWSISGRVIDRFWDRGYARVFAGGHNCLYAVTSNGKLHYFYHDDDYRWRVQAEKIGTDWGDFSSLASTGNGELYGVRKSDGALVYYRHDVERRFVNGGSPARIGTGWGGHGSHGIIASAR